MIAEKLFTPDNVVRNESAEPFYSTLAEEANKAIQTIYPGLAITPIEHPVQGDFNWYWENSNNIFNEGTFNYISARVRGGAIKGTAQMTPAGGFPNAYTQLIAGIAFTLNKADQVKLNKAKEDAEVQGQAVVGTYQEIYGQITDEEMKKASEATGIAIKTKLDYVIIYTLGGVWSGRLHQGKPPLTWTEMYEAPDLKKLLPQMPPSGEPVVIAVQGYLNILGPANALQDLLNLGAWIIQQMKTNTLFPSEKNGGMKLVDPEGSVSPKHQVGYRINKAISSIQNDLKNEKTSFSLKMSVSKSLHGQLQVSGLGGGTFDIDQVLSFGLTGHFAHNMNTFAGTSSTCKVTIKFPGFTMVPCEPTPWQQATNHGWFYGDPIAEAWKNWQSSGGNPDVTGFNFTAKPAFNLEPLAKGGDFGLIKSLLISNHPTVEVSYTNANYAHFEQSWKTALTGNLTLFGLIPIGRFSKGVYASTLVAGGTNQEFTVTFKPSPEFLTVPALQKTAYVIGGSFRFPGSPGSIVEQMLSRP